MKKVIIAIVCVLFCNIIFLPDHAFAASVPFFELNSTVYSPGETMEISLFNTGSFQEKRLEIVWNDTGDIIHRMNISTEHLNILAPVREGVYTINVFLDSETLSRRFSVSGNGENSCALTGEPVHNENGQIVGIRLEWQGMPGEQEYILTRTQTDGTSISYGPVNVSHWIDVNIAPNSSYTYFVSNVVPDVVSDGTVISNSVIIDLAEFVPSEYYKNNNTGIIELDVGDPYMIVNGYAKRIDPQDIGVAPVVIQDRVMLPISALVKEMGGTANWDSQTRTVILSAWEQKVEIPIGESTIRVNGQERRFDAAAVAERNRTLVPVRHLEILGCEVEWISETRSVIICYRQ